MPPAALPEPVFILSCLSLRDVAFWSLKLFFPLLVDGGGVPSCSPFLNPSRPQGVRGPRGEVCIRPV